MLEEFEKTEKGFKTEKVNYPECFKPEKYNPYPLCVGRDMPECEHCCICVDLPDCPF